MRDFDMSLGFMLNATHDLRAIRDSFGYLEEVNVAAIGPAAAEQALGRLQGDKGVSRVDVRTRSMTGPSAGQWSGWVVVFDRRKASQ